MNNYLAGSLINAATYKCADSPEGYGAFLRLFVCCCCCLFWGFLFPILDFSYFNYMRGANLGALLYGDASVMYVDSSE